MESDKLKLISQRESTRMTLIDSHVVEIFVICFDSFVGWFWTQLLRSYQKKELRWGKIYTGKTLHRLRSAECQHWMIGNLHTTRCDQQLHARRVGEHFHRWWNTFYGFIFECLCDRSQYFCFVWGLKNHKSQQTFALLITNNLYFRYNWYEFTLISNLPLAILIPTVE